MKKALYSLLSIGVISTLVVFASNAFFSDTETSTGNAFESGSLDLLVNGQNNPDSIIEVKDLKPGDDVYREKELTVQNPAYVWMHIKDLVDDQGEQYEPEEVEENQNGQQSNIQDFLTYDLSVRRNGIDDEVLIAAEDERLLLDMVSCWIPLGEIDSGTTTITQSFHFDEGVTNWAQGDKLTFTEEFYAEQVRNNPNASPPQRDMVWDSEQKICIQVDHICGDTVLYGGITYSTIQIGNQCWFKENLNGGNLIGNFELPDDIVPILNDPNSVQKWCYNDDQNYCNTEGGLYTWAEANDLPNSCNNDGSCSVITPNQGICPTGWHIPTDTEFYILENYLTDPGQTCDPLRSGDGCSSAGNKLLLGGSSGFDAIGAGNHEANGEFSFFDKREPSVHFWSATSFNEGRAYSRKILSSLQTADTVHRGNSLKTHGFSVRCIKNAI